VKYNTEKDVPYIEGSKNPRQELDIYRPQNAVGKRLPTIVYFHGGGWEFGEKENAIRRLENFFDTGYLMIAVGYRLSDEAIWPAPMDDAVAALKFIQNQIPDVDTERIALWGSSAGGHIACLLAGGCRSDTMPKLKCVVNYCAPVTINHFVMKLKGEARANSPVMKLLGGDHEKTEELAEEAAVTSWIKPGYPVTLSVHGDKDNVVPIEQSQILTQSIKEVGSEAFFHIAKDSEHRVDSLEVRQKVKAFLSKYL